MGTYPRHFLQVPPPTPPTLCPSADRAPLWYNGTDEAHRGHSLKHCNPLAAGKDQRPSKEVEQSR